MNNHQLPLNTVYTPEGAIAFIKTKRSQQVEELNTQVKDLQNELADMKNLLKEVLNERSK